MTLGGLVEPVALAVLAAVAAWGAWHRRWLTRSGAVAALGVGAAVWAGAGAGAVALLLAFFVSASLLTRLRASRRPRRPDGDAGGRSASQVLANGGVAAAAALAGLAVGWEGAQVAVVGALTAATADTWATEVGILAARGTRLITTWRPVPPGSSGGVSWPGTAAGLAGAAGLGTAAGWLGFTPSLAWAAVGLAAGAAGMVADSLAGALLEGRVPGVGNDQVNALGTLTGAAVAWLAAGGP